MSENLSDAEQPESLFPGRAGGWAAWTLGTVAALDLAAMMLLTFIDVMGRKFFASPVYGAYEVTEFMMGVLIFSALPMVTAREGHVTIDVFDHFIAPAIARWQRLAINLLSSGVLAVLAWRLWILSASHLRTVEVTMTLRIPHGPFTRAFAVMAVLAALACLVVAWSHLQRARSAR
jgi:TRAP-type C4-dicarboxylate transport system permease small subunit